MGNIADLSKRLNVLSTVSKSMADTSNILTNGVIFSTLKLADPHTVRGRSTQKDGVCNEHIISKRVIPRTQDTKESNDLADLANVVPESCQKSIVLCPKRPNNEAFSGLKRPTELYYN